MDSITTIKVYQKTKISLEKYREHRRESYDEVLKKLLYLVYLIKKNPELSKKLLEEIESTKQTLEKRRAYQEPKIVINQR